MLTLIEALNYRSLRYVRQPLRPFQFVVGKDGSGRSSFLDIPILLGDILLFGPEMAIKRRSPRPADLIFKRESNRLELCVEARIPPKLLFSGEYDTVRYEIALELSEEDGELLIDSERLLLKRGEESDQPFLKSEFPSPSIPPASIMTQTGVKGIRTIVHKLSNGNDYFYPESIEDEGRSWGMSFRFGRRRSALANLPEEKHLFPVSNWLFSLLTEGTLTYSTYTSQPDWSAVDDITELARGFNYMMADSSERFHRWRAELVRYFPGLRSIEVVADQPVHVSVMFNNGSALPEWSCSRGLIAAISLSAIGHLPEAPKICVVRTSTHHIEEQDLRSALNILKSIAGMQSFIIIQKNDVNLEPYEEYILQCELTEAGETDIEPATSFTSGGRLSGQESREDSLFDSDQTHQ